MQAIQTKYIPPTNTLGSRVSAKCSAGRIVVAWDYSLNPDENHKAAARALIIKLHWHRNHLRLLPGPIGPLVDGGEPRPLWYSGGLDDGSMVHVCARESEALDATGEPAREYRSPVHG